MNVATFYTQFPAFTQTDEVFVQAKLNEAAVRMGGPDMRRWGSFATPGQPPNFADLAQGNLAAYFLICDPQGGPTRMDPEKAKESTYYKKWLEMMYAVTPGITVSGGPRRFFPRGGFFP